MFPSRLCLSSFLLALCLTGGRDLRAQGVCDGGNGPLRPEQPAAIKPADIIQRFSVSEATFKAAREHYGFALSVKIQTLDNYGRVDGEYEQASEMMLNDVGKRVEATTFAPLSTLRRLSLTEDDFDDFRERLPFPLTPDQLPRYTIAYTGKQRVDELDTYVFDVSPKNAKKDSKLFSGRIWVEDQDLVVVKSCGKPREDANADGAKKNSPVSLTPTFVTYRQQVDRQFWFPAYFRADELLRFPQNMVHVREIIKYSDYHLLVRK